MDEVFLLLSGSDDLRSTLMSFWVPHRINLCVPVLHRFFESLIIYCFYLVLLFDLHLLLIAPSGKSVVDAQKEKLSNHQVKGRNIKTTCRKRLLVVYRCGNQAQLHHHRLTSKKNSKLHPIKTAPRQHSNMKRMSVPCHGGSRLNYSRRGLLVIYI